jgi:putative membrane protein
VPLGFWVQDLLDFSRNHYDRFGHIMQGFVPAIAVREILKRSSPVKGGGWLGFLTVMTCLAVSAMYEFLEWWVAIASGTAAEAFLATQGDVWDTQWDMFLALCGAAVAVLALSRTHDRALARMGLA